MSNVQTGTGKRVGGGMGRGRGRGRVGGDNAWKTGRLLDDKVSTNVYYRTIIALS
jgi:hypothetical protein